MAFHSLLDSAGGVLGRARVARIGDRAADLLKEAQDVPHAVLNLRQAQSVASHGDKLFRPEVSEVGYFARRHDDATGECDAVVFEEFVIFQTSLEQHLRIVADDGGLPLAIQRDDCLRAEILDLISGEEDSLAEEVR